MLLFMAALSCLASGLLILEMTAKLNQDLPEQEHVSFAFWRYGKCRELFRRYHSTCPEGSLAKYSKLAFAASVVFLVGCAWVLGFFG